MNAIIGEIVSDFSFHSEENGNVLYQQTLSGSAILFAELLKNWGKDFEIVTKLGGDNIARSIENTIKELYGKSLDYSIPSPFHSAISIDGDIRLNGTAPATLNVEELEPILDNLKPSNIMVSGALLSVNPASSAIIDAISFMDNRPRVFVDLSSSATCYKSMELLHRNVGELATIVDTYIIGDTVRAENARRIEKEHLLEYLEE